MTTSATLGNAPADLWVQSTHGQMFVRSWFPDAGALRESQVAVYSGQRSVTQWQSIPDTAQAAALMTWAHMPDLVAVAA